jgi:hypothetical protein
MKNKINIIGIIGEEQYKNIVIDILICYITLARGKITNNIVKLH